MSNDPSTHSAVPGSEPAPLSPQQLSQALGTFTGTDAWYRYGPLLTHLTDGVKFLADQANCYWLLDAIASHQPTIDRHPDGRLRYMQFWKLLVNADKSAVLTCVPDTDEPATVKQEIPFTDFPLPEIDVWVVDDGKNKVAILPGEY